MRSRSKFFWPALTVLTVMFTLSSLAVASLGSVAFAGMSPTISSEQPDYLAGSWATLNGSGWDAQEAVHIYVNDNDGQTWSYNTDVTADDQGNLTTSFQLPNWFVATYYVTATGASSGTATTTFTDAAPPSSTVTFPTQNSYYNNAGWDAGCAAAGFCGTATGGKGSANADLNLVGVNVAIQKGTGVAARWWDGTGFTQTSQFFVAATLVGSGHGPLNWSYGFGHASFPEENTYKVFPQAVDTDNTENGNAGKTFFIDRTAPTSSITCNAAACSGTYSGSVTVGLSATDPLLGTTTLAGSGVQKIKYTTDGSNPTSSGTASTISGSSGSFSISATTTVKWAAYDNAGNVSSVQSQTITFGVTDSTAPVVTVTIDAADTVAGSGWYNIASSGTDGVLVHVSASDPSGVTNITCTDNGTTTLINASTNPNSFVLGNGSHSIACTATDGSSNTGAGAGSTAMPIPLLIDQAAPTISAALDKSPAGTGWFNISTGAPTVSFTCGDTGSSGLLSCPASHLFGEGASQSWNGTAYDNAGNSASDGVTGVNVDLTAPTITLTTPPQGANYTVGQVVAASYSCADTGSSLLASCVGTTANGANISTTPGSHSFTVNASDNAGNTNSVTHTYGATYIFNGFLQPVDNPNVVNMGKVGRTYPVKWQLMDANGFVTDLSAVDSITVKATSCSGFGTDPTDALEATATGGTSLRYDFTANQFVYNWYTGNTKGCFTLFLTLDDGTVHYAFFNLTK
jgi:Chitobiase/beta-hexosaminidase C-terminal domain